MSTRVQITQERAEEIIRALQPLADESQIQALAGQLRRMLAKDSVSEPVDTSEFEAEGHA